VGAVAACGWNGKGTIESESKKSPHGAIPHLGQLRVRSEVLFVLEPDLLLQSGIDHGAISSSQARAVHCKRGAAHSRAAAAGRRTSRRSIQPSILPEHQSRPTLSRSSCSFSFSLSPPALAMLATVAFFFKQKKLSLLLCTRARSSVDKDRRTPRAPSSPRAAPGKALMSRLLAVTVSLALVCTPGSAFSGAGSALARPCPSAGAHACAPCDRHAAGSLAGHRSRPSLLLSSPRGAAGLLTRMRAESEGAKGGGRDADGRQRESYMVDRMAKVPILGIFVRFARWVASVFRSILLVRMAVLLQAVAKAKEALLDPQRRLVRDPVPRPAAAHE